MKNFIFTIAIFFITLAAYAQDVITLKNGTEIKGVVTEVGTDNIKFKKSADGPVYVMAKSEIQEIVYENGTKDVFNGTSTTTTSGTSTTPTNTNSNSKGSKIGQYNGNADESTLPQKHYGGPRVGITMFESGLISDQIGTNVITQFGWQFETRFFTLENGASGLFEVLPMFGGLERGQFLPSLTTVVGFRTGKGYEFGMGPTLSRSGLGMVFAAGTSFSAGHVCIPVNIAFQPGVDKDVSYTTWETGSNGYTVPIYHSQKLNTGFRVSLLVGFNSRTK